MRLYRHALDPPPVSITTDPPQHLKLISFYIHLEEGDALSTWHLLAQEL